MKGQISQKVTLDKTWCNFLCVSVSKSFTIFPATSHTELQERDTFWDSQAVFSCLSLCFWLQATQRPFKPWASLSGKDCGSVYGFSFVVIKLEQISQVSSKLNQSLSVHLVVMLMYTLNKRTLFSPVNMLRRIGILHFGIPATSNLKIVEPKIIFGFLFFSNTSLDVWLSFVSRICICENRSMNIEKH